MKTLRDFNILHMFTHPFQYSGSDKIWWRSLCGMTISGAMSESSTGVSCKKCLDKMTGTDQSWNHRLIRYQFNKCIDSAPESFRMPIIGE